METITAETAQRGMYVWAIVEGKPYVCVIQEKGARSDSHKCALNFVKGQETQDLRIGWRRYDQLLESKNKGLTADELDYLLQNAKEPEPLTPHQQAQKMAKELEFDYLIGPGYKIEYFVLCSPELDEVQMFANNESGYTKAMAWMKHLIEKYKPHPEACTCDQCAADRFAYCGYED